MFCSRFGGEEDTDLDGFLRYQESAPLGCVRKICWRIGLVWFQEAIQEPTKGKTVGFA